MAQLVAEHPLHPDDELEVFVSAEALDMEDFVTKPHFEIIFARSVLEHDGHLGVSFPRTSFSKLFPHSLHLNSYIGIFFPELFFYVFLKKNILQFF